MHYRCRLTEYPVDGDWEVDVSDQRVCGSFHQCKIACGSLYDTTFYINGSEVYFDLYQVTDFSRDSLTYQLNYGLSSFDNVLKGMVTVFQVQTMDHWSRVMKFFQDGFNYYISSFYFICCTIICQYFIHNMTIAILLNVYNAINQREFENSLITKQ